MTTLQNGDSFLVQRTDTQSGISTNYQVSQENLMANLADDDLLLVQRTSAGISTNYCITGSDLKEDLGGVNGLIVPPVEVLTPLNGSGITVFDQYEPLSSTITAVGEAGTITKNTDDIQSVAAAYRGVFSGSNYLSVPSSTAFAYGTGSFTTEAWIYPTNISGLNGIFSTSAGPNPVPKYIFYTDNGILKVHFNGMNTGSITYQSSSSVAINEWSHVAFVRSGTTWTFYINGVASGTGSDSTNVTLSTQPTYVGYGGESWNRPFAGYISNLRVVSGTSVYTADFTPPTRTEPLTAISGTSILTLQSSTLIDESANSFSLTNVGNVTVESDEKVLSFPTNTNFSGLSVGDVVQATATGSIRASYVDDDNTIELKDASGVYIKVPSSYSTGSVVDFSDFLQQHNITKVVGIRLISNNSNGGYPVRLYRLEINGLQYEKGDRTTGETIVISNETGTASNNASADDWMNVNTGARYVRSDDNASYSFDFSPNNEPTQAATITAIDASGPSQTDVYATLNPNDKHNAISLSNGNLSFSHTESNVGVRATTGISSGKYYWEVTNTSAGTGNFTAGIASSAWTLTYVGANNGYGFASQSGFYPGSGTNDNVDANTTGDVVGFAFDADAGTLETYVNGVIQYSAAGWGTIPSGTWYPAFGSGAGGTQTVNFGETAFAYTPPTGYTGLSETVTTYPSVTVDGGTWNTSNQSQVWSANTAATAGYLTTPATMAFDGDLTTHGGTSGGGTLTIDLSAFSLPVAPVRVRGYIIGGIYYSINGGAEVQVTTLSNESGPAWIDLGTIALSTLVVRGTGGLGAGVYAIEVDGKLLVDAGVSGLGDRYLGSSISYEKSLTFSDTTELANMVTPLEMVDANGDVVTPVSDTIANVNNNVLTLQGDTNLEYFQPGDEVQTGVEIVSVDQNAPSITVDGGEWLGADGTNSAKRISKSLRFNSADSAYLSRTPSSAGNRKTWTWSGWVKRSTLTSGQCLFMCEISFSEYASLMFNASDQLQSYLDDDGSSGYVTNATNAVFRDVSAWYHVVWAVDSTNVTASDRVKLYVNGVDQSYTGSNIPLNGSYPINSTTTHSTGIRLYNNADKLDAYLADVHFIDGQALAPTDFGEFDDNNVWQAKEFEGTHNDSGQMFSNTLTTNDPDGFPANYPASFAFNGNENSNTFINISSNTITWDASSYNINVNSTVRVRVYNQNTITVTTDTGSQTVTSSSGGTFFWSPTINISGKLLSVETTGGANLAAIEVDGVHLTDTPAGANGFHLDFADNSSNAALGYDAAGSNDWTVNNLTAESPGTSLPGVHFDGTGDELSIPNNTDFIFGSSDFTIEGFFLLKRHSAGVTSHLFGINNGANVVPKMSGYVHPDGAIHFMFSPGGTYFTFSTNAGVISPNTWYHIAFVRSGNAFNIYVDGVSVASGTSTLSISGLTQPFYLGYIGEPYGTRLNGYISNFRLVKGTALYTSSFTVPTTPLANVTNTKLLCCQSTSSTTASVVTPGTITANGDPTAGTFTSTGSAANDSLVDIPTNYGDDTGAGGEVRGNYCTLNPLAKGAATTLSNGNLNYVGGAANQTLGTIGMSSGKWYWEDHKVSGTYGATGIALADAPLDNHPGQGNTWAYNKTGYKWHNGSASSYGASWDSGDTIGIAFDADAGTLTFYKNGASQGVAFTGLTNGPYFVTGADYDVTGYFNFGQRPFAYTAPSGYKALCDTNLPSATIKDGSAYMDVLTWTGDGSSTRSLTGLGFNPDLVWIKSRSVNNDHNLFDSVRGVEKTLSSNLTSAEVNQPIHGYVTSFDSDGFSVAGGSLGDVNYASRTYVGWAWDAGANSNKTYNVTVVSGKYHFDGHANSAVTLDLEKGSTYVFDQSDSSNSGHPLRFGTSANGTDYTTGVTHTGTPGTAGAKTTLVIASDAPTLFYSCNLHSGMGGQINTNSTAGATVLSGSLNSSVYDQSQTWSNGAVSINNTGGTPGSYSNAIYNFDNDITNWGNFAPNHTGTITWTYTFPTALTGVTSIRVYAYNGDLGGTRNNSYGVNSSSYQAGQGTDGTASWQDLTSLLTGTTVTQITGTFGVPSGQTSPRSLFQALEINGKRLLDPSVTPTNEFPSINSVVRANPAAGFSIVSWAASAAGSTIGHGLNAAPEMIIAKSRNSTQPWVVYHSALGKGGVLQLHRTDANITSYSQYWGVNEPSSTVFGTYTGAYPWANNYGNMVAYCFAPVEGYSAISSYTGNGSTDGPFVHTGFRPAFVLIKGNQTISWHLFDNKREGYNVANDALLTNHPDGEFSNVYLDLLSNGFKVRQSTNGLNSSNVDYIYIAFAENPVAQDAQVVTTGDTQVALDALVAAATEIVETDGTTMYLNDATGPWRTGLSIEGSQINDAPPGPSEITFTSQNQGTPTFTGVDATLASRTWTLESSTTSTGPWTLVDTYSDFGVLNTQTGATPWTENKPTLQPNTYYRVKVAYNSTNADSVESVYSTFKTGDA